MKQKVVVGFRMREKDYEKIKSVAEQKDRKPTELIRLIVENWIKSQEI